MNQQQVSVMNNAAKIRRNQKESLIELNQIERDSLNELKYLYETAVRQLNERYMHYTDQEGVIRVDFLQQLLSAIDESLSIMHSQKKEIIVTSLNAAAGSGAVLIAGNEALHGVAETRAVRAVINNKQADKLNLSQRLWRLHQKEKNELLQEISLAVVRGDSAFKSARDFIDNGISVPLNIKSDSNLSKTRNINKITSESLLKNKSGALYNAQRLFRTEIARAHTLAYINSVEDVDGVIGFRFNLSSAHKKTDICDMHAKVNLYGLGAGVYPKDVINRIYPAHPQTTSNVSAVFDENKSVNEETHKNRIEWLMKQSMKVKIGILGVTKTDFLEKGLLTDRTINSKVRALKKRFS